MPVEDTTTGRGYPKPHPTNPLAIDVQRLRDALDQIDADVDATTAPTIAANLADVLTINEDAELSAVDLGQDRIWYYNATSGTVTELAIGDNLTITDGILNATAGEGTPGDPGPQGDDGEPGDPGLPGSQIYLISDEPGSELGINGDYAWWRDESLLYGPKTAGDWGVPALLKGADGIDGDDGEDSTVPGPVGPPGPSLTLRGTVQSNEDLPIDPANGDAYRVIDPDEPGQPNSLFVWNGIEEIWVDAGPIQGPEGPASTVPGPSGTIAVGSTTTSAPGGNAVVVNSGTSTAAIFDFTIPRGIQGPTGSAGPSGGGTLAGRLSGGVNASVTSIRATVNAEWVGVAAEIHGFGGTYRILINNELMTVTNTVQFSGSVYTLTVQRGALGTAPANHNNNSVVQMRQLLGAPGPPGETPPPLERAVVSHTTGSLADAASADFTIEVGQVAELLQATISHASWVRFYRSAAQRTADTRTVPGGTLQEMIDLGDARPYAEVVTTGASQTVVVGSLILGDGGGLAYVRLRNNSGGSAAITLDSTILTLEP
jgi:hypothetical protein